MPARLSREEIDAFLDSHPGWLVLSTHGSDGFPHSVPLGYFRMGASVCCGVRDGTTKVRNIEADDRVSALVEAGSTMADIRGVMMQGHAIVHRAPEKVLELMRYAAQRRGVGDNDLPRAARPGIVYLEIRPERYRSWDYGRDSAPVT